MDPQDVTAGGGKADGNPDCSGKSFFDRASQDF
jgi:hypothetical protein